MVFKYNQIKIFIISIISLFTLFNFNVVDSKKSQYVIKFLHHNESIPLENISNDLNKFNEISRTKYNISTSSILFEINNRNLNYKIISDVLSKWKITNSRYTIEHILF